MPGRPMAGVRQQHVPNQYRNNRGQTSNNRHQVNHAPYATHMNTSQASQVTPVCYPYYTPTISFTFPFHLNVPLI